MIELPYKKSQTFHGWKVLVLATFSLLVSVGLSTYLIGIYLEPLTKAFSATTGQLGWAATIVVLMKAGLGPLLGHWIDRGHVRVVLTGGAVLQAAGLMLLSQAQDLVQAAICTLLIATGAAMLGMIPAMGMVLQWFDRRRGMAVGIAAAGMSVGGFLVPPIAAWLIHTLDWRGSLVVLGAAIGVFLVPAAWVIAVAKPSNMGQHPDGETTPKEFAERAIEGASIRLGDLVRSSSFWLMAIPVGAMSFSGILMITYLVPFAGERGIDLKVSAWILSVYAICGIAGKFASGWLCDHMRPNNVLTLVLATVALAWLLLLYLDSVTSFLIVAAVLGVSLGSLVTIWTSLIASQFGASAFGRVKGYMSLALLGVNVMPGPLAGYLHDSYGSYDSTFALLWWLLPVGIASSLILSWRRSSSFASAY